MEINLSCSCGKLKGLLRGPKSQRKNLFVCTCSDCRDFNRYLGKDSSGAMIFPSYPSHLKFTQGKEQLRCLRLSFKGLYRWYTECCKTPVANSNPDTTYLGVSRACIDLSDVQLETALGPSYATVDGKTIPLKIVPVITRFLINGVLKNKKSPNPFYSENSWKPISDPHVLSDEERHNLRPSDLSHYSN